MADKLYLVDGSAFAFRSFYAIRELTDSRGHPVNAVYGVSRMLLKLLREQDPSHIAVIFDAPGKTFRNEMYPEYKANRAAVPEALIAQMPLLEELVSTFPIVMIREPGIEADDVMGTLTRLTVQQGMDVVLVTGDKDMLQLVSDKVRVYDPNKGKQGTWLGPEEVMERFGVPPERVVDALGLMGDSADNVPGVPGIGPKTARTLLEKYKTIEGIYEHLDELTPKQRERFEQARDLAFLSRELVTIRTDIDLAIKPEDCRRQPVNVQGLSELFSRFEFHSLLAELPGNQELNTETLRYRVILTEDELDVAIEEMRSAGIFSLDTETTSVDPMRAKLVGISLSCREQTGYYIPVGHTARELLDEKETDEYPCDAQLPLDTVLKKLRPLLEDDRIGKVGHNIKYDLIVLNRNGVSLKGIVFDTMVASYLTDPSRLRHNLDDVSLHLLNRKLIPISELIGKGSKSITFDKVPIRDAYKYACEDADIAWRLRQVLASMLAERGLEDLFKQLELPLIEVLAQMEQNGIAIDAALFEELKQEIAEKLATLEKKIYETAGESFQINSPKQLQHILFDKLGLKPIRKTKTGYSTDMEVLGQLSIQHPLPAMVLEYRGLEKLRNTYVEALPRMVHPETKRIHTSFNQAVTATGRLSSSEPNLQNIPIRTEIGRRIRQGFVPGDDDSRDGMRLIAADYSQIELRILAHLSGDPAMREAFEKGADIHQDTAARIFGVFPEMVTPEMRRQAKAVNFGVVYGISPFGLARNVGISQREASHFIDEYFKQFPRIKAWITETVERAKQQGYVTTLMNRRRYIEGLDSANSQVRRAAERVAINTPVQGSAADIIKVAMVQLHPLLQEYGARMLLQVHDELVVEVPVAAANTVAELMREKMKNAVTLDVPLRVDIGIGKNWAEAH